MKTNQAQATARKNTVRAWEDCGALFARSSSIRTVATVRPVDGRFLWTFFPAQCGFLGNASPIRGTCDTQAEAMSRADGHVDL